MHLIFYNQKKIVYNFKLTSQTSEIPILQCAYSAEELEPNLQLVHTAMDT